MTINQNTNDIRHMTAAAGQTVKLCFGVYNNGCGGVTAMYVDDVSLETCR